MKNYLRLALITLVGIAVFTGCATTQTLITENLLSTGRYKKELVPNTQTYFRQIWAVEEEGKLRISGYLRLKGSSGVNIPDQVEVALLNPNGQLIESHKVAYSPSSLYGRKNHREGRFRAIFAQVPPEGATIRLSNVN